MRVPGVRVDRGLRGAPLAALWLAACALAGAQATAPPHKGTKTPTSLDTAEDEVESAEYAVVIEHSNGWRCGGALISLQVALTTADCMRGSRAVVDTTTVAANDLWVPAPAVPGAMWARAPVLRTWDDTSPRVRASRATPVPLKDIETDLWVRASAPSAPHTEAARRVTRVALASDAEKQKVTSGEKPAPETWLAAMSDLALVELEAPFGPAAHARPILMAESLDECAPRARRGPSPAPAPECVVVRTPLHARGPLLAANTAPASPTVCAARAPFWDEVEDKVLCFTGANFCPSDWGVGVVCGGKLCGVLSRSKRSGDGAAAAEQGCGDTHAAQLVPQWRTFIHCAQPAGQCGRGSCESVCSERLLLQEPDDDGSGDDGGAAREATVTSPTETESSKHPHLPARTFMMRAAKTAASLPGLPTGLSAQRSPFDFQVPPKAGEFGDNSGSYESAEETPKASKSAEAARGRSGPTKANTTASPRAGAAATKRSLRTSAAARPPPGDSTLLMLCFCIFYICVYR